MQQTLALYGNELSARYQDYSNNWHDVTFTFSGFLPASDLTIESADIQNASTGAPAYIRDYIRATDFLVYTVNPTSWLINTSDLRTLHITASFSIDIQDIDVYHQIMLHSSLYAPPFYVPYNEVTITSTASASPLFFPTFYYTSGGNTRPETVRISAPFLADNADPQSGMMDFAMNECIVNSGTSTDSFAISAQTLSLTAPGAITDTSGNNAFVILIGCPTLTEGYYSPDITTEYVPEYMPILSDMRLRLDYINIDLEEVNERLRAIQIQLQAIYERMLQDGVLSPDLIPAATIPRTLDQYYSGIASGAPSASGINAGASGGAIVPLSDIITASGMSQIFGLLVGLCCAGWVLTTGRKG